MYLLRRLLLLSWIAPVVTYGLCRQTSTLCRKAFANVVEICVISNLKYIKRLEHNTMNQLYSLHQAVMPEWNTDFTKWHAVKFSTQMKCYFYRWKSTRFCLFCVVLVILNNQWNRTITITNTTHAINTYSPSKSIFIYWCLICFALQSKWIQPIPFSSKLTIRKLISKKHMKSHWPAFIYQEKLASSWITFLFRDFNQSKFIFFLNNSLIYFKTFATLIRNLDRIANHFQLSMHYR